MIRDYNESYTERTGVVQPQTESLKIFGGISKTDRALVATQGKLNNIRAIHDQMKAKVAVRHFIVAFFKGDSQADSKPFDGLEKRVTGSQVLYAGGYRRWI